jgi:hypothetical protein
MTQSSRGALVEFLVPNPCIYAQESDNLVFLVIVGNGEASQNLETSAIVDVVSKLAKDRSEFGEMKV